MDPQELWASMDVCCRLHGGARRAGDRLKPLIGQMLVRMKEHPELYKSRGYATWDKFLEFGVPEIFNVRRTEAYYLVKVIETFPELSVEDYYRKGIAKLQIATRAVRDVPSCRDKILQKTEEMTVEEFKMHVAQVTHSDQRDYDYAQIVVHTTQSVKDRWSLYLPEVKAMLGMTSDSDIIDAMMAETLSTWTAQADAAAR